MNGSTKVNSAVTIDSVVKHYDDVVAVNDVSIDVAEGEFVTLLGPSGCGKSTLLRMISGFLEPTSGDIRLHGHSVLGVPPYRRNTSLVFQDYALFPHRTVAQNLAFGLRMRRVPAAEIATRVKALLDLLGLPGMGDRRISEISGGQQQRVALGRALIVEPAVLLLDEPLGALDYKLRKQMQSELKRIQRQIGITFIYVTHDQDEALTMSDRIAVMNHGKVEQLARPEEVYKHPATAFVADFVGETNMIACTVVGADKDSLRVRDEFDQVFRAQTYHTPHPSSGTAARLVIRPESIRLVDGAGEASSNLRGQVDEVIFSGASVRVTVRTGGDRAMQVSVPVGGRVPARGDTVGLDWSDEAAVVV